MKTFTIAAVGLSLIASVLAGGSGNYQQCGGVGFSGSTSCADGWKCLCQNKYYSQCLPPNQPAPNGWNQAGCPGSSSGGSTPQPPASSPPAASNPPATKPGSTGSSGTCSVYSGSKTGYATTTHYYDGNKGACGCGGSNAFSWQSGSGSIWTAAGSAALFDNGGASQWCGGGCGGCYELENVGAIAASGQGDCTGKGQKITVQITNLCPAQGNEQWCNSPSNQYGYGAHFDIMAQGAPAGGWNNPVVKYTKIDCPADLKSRYQQCECAGTSRVKRGLLQNSLLEG